MNTIKQEYRDIWLNAYNKLNPKQKEAVDAIEGPVMTIAGPGTGKTQLLAVRIGNILEKTDVYPHNILCLTYTEAGAIEMRQRLSSFIGPEAYNVNIYTFHAFCNTVIKENLQYFGDFRELQLISDIEEAEIYRQLIDNFDDKHVLKRYKSDEYFEIRRLKNLFTTMKQEKWTTEQIKLSFDIFKKESLDPETSPFRWGRSGRDKNGIPYQKGDFNAEKAKAEVEKYEKGVAAAGELQNYNTILSERERFDFQDMILWVIEKFKLFDELLGKYQERYQYILVDEYQDTNGAQNELLFLLTEYWDQPNLFIVGDDDQSIFRFQGANMNSILDFKKKYDPVEIVLTENYRSSQKILDSAKLLISNNQERLVNKYPYLVKDLKSVRNVDPLQNTGPEIFQYVNEAQEEAGIISRIRQLHEKGVPYREIAVIYTKHRTVENLVKYFSQIKIPVNVKRRINVLYEHEVVRIMNILEYLENEYSKPHSSEDVLFEMLHYDFFELNTLDIAAISIYCRKKNETEDEKDQYKRWREVICDRIKLKEAGVKHSENFLRVSGLIEGWIKDSVNVTIQTLIEKIMTESNLLQCILNSPEKAWKLQLVNTFFDFVKEEAAKVKMLSLKQLVSTIKLMRETHIELPVNRILSNENGINFLTAHGSKGLEFEHVFIMRCNKNHWEGRSGRNDSFSLPPTLTRSTNETEEEDDRRLFYVAMTRAKNFLYISYPEHDEKEKKSEATKFVAEIKEAAGKLLNTPVEEAEVLGYKAELLKYQQGEAILIEHQLIDKILENFKISATSLNKYLKCKLTFYFENILRVPMGRSASMGFGNAIHYGLEQFFRDIEKSIPRSIASKKRLCEYFAKGMELYKSHFTAQEFENYSKYGTNILSEYYDEYATEWLTPIKYELEYSIPGTVYQGVPISGKLDRINIFEDHVSVTDYKTGSYDSKKLKGPTGDEADAGGDYWRQIMFYRLLLDGDKRNNWIMKTGIMDFVEKDKLSKKYKNQKFTIDSFETEIVGRQLVNAYNEIKNHIFTPGCGSQDCMWCNFVNKNMPVTIPQPDEDADEIIRNAE